MVLLLDELAHSFDLVVANSDGDGEQHWTFESSMGVRRRIDFVLCSLFSSRIFSLSLVNRDLVPPNRTKSTHSPE